MRTNLHFRAILAPQRPAIQRLRLGETKQGVIAKLGHGGRGATRIQVIGTGQHADAVAAQRPRVQRGIAQRADTDRHVGAVFEQIDDLVVGIQFELDFRVSRAEGADQRHHHVQHERRRCVHPQPPCRPLAPQRHLLLGQICRRQDLARVGEHRRALLGQLQPPRGPAQQRGFQLLLQPGQRPADPGDGLVELLRSGGDRAAIHHGRKGEQFF
ncbi:hypothetical protein D3C72_1076710 [compost metagenome]